MGILEAYASAASMLFQPLPLLALLLGVIVAMIGGAIPGGSLPTLIILLGFAYHIDPVIGIAIVVGGAVTNTADSVPAILLGVPGGATGQATILDGYPMSRRGEASRALAVSYLSSLAGGLIGAIGFFFSIMAAREIIQLFGSPEFFMLAILGITMVAIVSSGAFLKGLVGASVALALTMIGFDNITGTLRYTFDIEYLWDGIPLVPVLVGLFALPEMFNLMLSGRSVSEQADAAIKRTDFKFKYLDAIKEVFQHRWLVFRTSMIGLVVGLMPGVGTVAAHWLAYTHAYQSEKGARETFGTGDVRGVIAPDAANNAIDGGQIVPTLAVGIPGSSHQAILLAFLVLMGFVPGPQMLDANLNITLLFGIGIVLANVIATGLAFYFTPWLARISFIRPGVLVPCIIVIVTLSAFRANMSVIDLAIMALFGVIGVFMKIYGWPRPPVIIAIVLGEQLNQYFWLSVNSFGWSMFLRPQLLVILAICVAVVWFAVRVQRSTSETVARASHEEGGGSAPSSSGMPDDRRGGGAS
jgi:TctA family transporter